MEETRKQPSKLEGQGGSLLGKVIGAVLTVGVSGFWFGIGATLGSKVSHNLEELNSRYNKKRSHTQLDSRKQVTAFQDRVITIKIKEAQHPLKREKQVIDKSSIMLKISTKSMHRVLV